MRIRNFFLALSALLCAIALPGCAVFGETDPVARIAADQKKIEKRVLARWDAIIAVNFDAVYEFASPAYRQTYDLVHLKNQYAAQLKRKRVEIYKTEIDPATPDSAKVVVLLYFEAEGGAPGTTFETFSRVVETWVRDGGKWWYVEPR
ncbi:MAG: hypothetical protein WC809_12525 [Sinimarinibacterium sp.]|jgi:hypothetical protein